MKKIIDSHTHLWHCKGTYFDWIDAESPIRRDFLIQDLEKVLRENSVAGAVLVQAMPEIDETRWLLDIAEQSNPIKGVIGWVDINKGKAVTNDIDALMGHSTLLKGIRYMSQGLDPNHLTTLQFIDGVKAVGEAGLVYELLIIEAQLAAAHQLISACPDVQFVIEHIAKPNIREGRIDVWQKGIEAIAKDFENVACKVSGVVTEADLASWGLQYIEPYLAVIFENFGTARTLFGSDWPVCLLAATYQTWLATVDQFLREQQIQHTEAFFAENAVRIYQL